MTTTPTMNNTDENVDTPTNDFVGEERFDTILSAVETQLKVFKEIQKSVKELKKDYTKEKKAFIKNSKKKKVVDPDAAVKQNGFSKPLNISTDLKNFLEIPMDSMMSRTQVTKAIANFIRDNDLLNVDNRREINIWKESTHGDLLRNLLQPSSGDVITWFNLQKYLAKHYPKGDTVATVIPPTETVQKAVTPSPPVRKTRAPRVRTRA